MRTSEENIRQLLEMLDNPDAYTEQQMRDIINRDEDTHETYRLMVEAKCSSRHRQHQGAVDVDAAWQRLNQKLQPKQQGLGGMKILCRAKRQSRAAASFIGVLLVSGIAFAAIHIWSLTPTPSPKGEGNSYIQVSDTTRQSSSLPSEGSGEATPVIYDNTPLEKMLPEIAAHYDVKVIFANDEVRGLRFRFVWNPQQGIGQVVSDLNQFERLTVTLKGNQITVDGLSGPSEK